MAACTATAISASVLPLADAPTSSTTDPTSGTVRRNRGRSATSLPAAASKTASCATSSSDDVTMAMLIS